MWQGSGFGKHRKFYTNARSSPSAVLDTVRAEAERLDSALGGSVRWEDSRIMSAFDSVWLAANALKEIPPGADEGAPSLEDVRSQWRATYSGQGVPGVTGWLCLDNDGNPYNKAVAVVTLDQSDRTVRFGGMGWPEGEASPDCEVPSSG
jgi:ABC-type branched-subunit amino acid transport system substrate-binding protein